ncbi:MAG: hypothetical protein H0Z39_06720 [Peptococcaceae bacterium]|nr:hypothetical protein [Peptococcaceae bacterium]
MLNIRRLTLALIAHDAKKKELVSFVNSNREVLSPCSLVATGNKYM